MDPSTLTLLTLFIAVTALAVLVQMGILIALFLSIKKTSARVDSLANDLERRGLPVLDAAHTILLESRVNLGNLTSNLAATSASVRSQVERFDGAVDDLLDRTRLQVIRADQMVSRTLDRVEETTEMVQETVVSPVRQIAALVHGLQVGIDTLVGRSRKRASPREVVRASQEEEMFI
ncbi:MAG: hypothetical protein ACRD2R_00825, partial [Terriglobales bacterium]